jgi:hypothetical protein
MFLARRLEKETQMHRQLELRLAKHFPIFFQGLAVDTPKNRKLMFGVEHGNGWYGILYALGQAVEPYCAESGEYVSQIKEKFGTLRVYTDCGHGDSEYAIHAETPGQITLAPVSHDENIARYITAAEKESAITCESCGGPGDIGSSGGWYSTLCAICRVAFVKRSRTGTVDPAPIEAAVQRFLVNVIAKVHPGEHRYWRHVLLGTPQ